MSLVDGDGNVDRRLLPIILLFGLLNLALPLSAAVATPPLSTQVASTLTPIPLPPSTADLTPFTPTRPGPVATSPDAPRDPYYRFLTQIASQQGKASPEETAQAAWEMFRGYGIQAPAWEDLAPRTDSSNARTDEINETAMLSFTYPVGDVDGDGMDDFAFDKYCADWDVCLEPRDIINLDWWWCSLGHWLEGVNGVDGERRWINKLDASLSLLPEVGGINPGGLLGCGWDFVIGTFPNDDGTRNVLVYRFEFTWGWTYLHHDIYAVNSKTGRTVWHYNETGVNAWLAASNMFVLPILQTPPFAGPDLLPNGTQTTLHVRSIGYASIGFCVCTSRIGGPDVVAVSEYQPLEWAARLDPKTGDEMWHKDTFQPRIERSVYPIHYGIWGGFAAWFATPCCWDNTGDHIPDVFFTTYEWDPVQVLLDKPFRMGSRAVVFDGQSGDLKWSTVTVPDTAVGWWDGLYRIYFTWVQDLGDADGDGVSDFFQHLWYVNYTSDWHAKDRDIHMFVRDGKDGHAFWNMKAKEWLDPLVLGDANGDGGNDFLLGYYDLGEDVDDGLVNVTDTRLVVHNGRDGVIVWEVASQTAPIDLIFMFINSRKNGLIDLDDDNVGDVWVDRPEQKDDLTVVHHTSFLRGTNGDPFFTVASVGAYAFPIRAGDLDGDGGSDFTITQGDIVDVWITGYNGREANPLWSRRLLTIPVSGAILSIPFLQYHTAQLDTNATMDQLFSISMYVFQAGGGRVTRSFYPQHLADRGHEGSLVWARPMIEEGDESLWICAPTPATSLYTGIPGCDLSPPEPKSAMQVAAVPVAMTLSGGASLAVAFMLLRRRWRA